MLEDMRPEYWLPFPPITNFIKNLIVICQGISDAADVEKRFLTNRNQSPLRCDVHHAALALSSVVKLSIMLSSLKKALVLQLV